MPRGRKKKETAVPYEFIEEVNKMSKDQVVLRFLQEENDINALKEKQTQAKKFRSENKRDDMESMSDTVKEAIEEIEEQIAELKDRKRELKEGSREETLEEDAKALKEAAKDLNEEVKRRLAYRNYLYNQLNVAYGVQMTTEAK